MSNVFWHFIEVYKRNAPILTKLEVTTMLQKTDHFFVFLWRNFLFPLIIFVSFSIIFVLSGFPRICHFGVCSCLFQLCIVEKQQAGI